MQKVFEEYLGKIDEVIKQGPYDDTWESLSSYKIPYWFSSAKFGIFIHWGVYSVPAYFSEWYPKYMYDISSPVFEHHVKTYGPHKLFGYKDFIPMFKGEKFDPAKWSALIKASGARYAVPVAEAFQLRQSAPVEGATQPFRAQPLRGHAGDDLRCLRPTEMLPQIRA